MLLACVAGTSAQETGIVPTTKLVMVSTEIPIDSLGETVYSYKGKEDNDRPTVPGVLTNPSPIKEVTPKMPKGLKKKRFQGDITVTGVVTSTGAVIDISGQDGEDVDATASAIEAVKHYRFAPARLDGKPVAVRLRVIVHFLIY